MKKLLILVWTLTAASAQAANPMTTTTDTKAVLGLLRGNVDMYGVNFGSTEFQRGILQLAQQKVIRVRVMTSPKVAQNFKPLKAVGAGIYTIPANFTNSMIVVQGGAVIIPTKSNYQIITDQRNAAAMTGLMTQYWQISKPY
ncbi:hypothetical protein DVJ83_15570 (plasmid) [Deinococcus wulumuqiensis]|uniref:Uncharacterized protein n=1 Tax=Deinococcus wulumuqiensis TaxID=980427 RepID=A0A345ILL4_9DEIO|nr:hypothetical protein [Deinococcus wulumuqiensis]AXH00587.1 hypothetical protein DVJ83_15570 [Deinococcus wulumuqiensis]